jgi:hypothetical protein
VNNYRSHAIEDVRSHNIVEIVGLAHIEQRKVNRVVYVSEAVNVRKSQLGWHTVTKLVFLAFHYYYLGFLP